MEKLKSFEAFNNPLSWFAVLASLICVGLLIANGNFLSAVCLFVLLTFTFYLQLRENRLRALELHRKVRDVLADLQAARVLCEDWEPSNYPHIFSPLSPCVTLQWTYRNGRIVNLPWALLVRGDYIVMRPGQCSPEACTEITGKCKFSAGEMYRLSNPIEPPPKPTARPPLPDIVCILEKTPFADNLQTALENFSNRPPTIYDQQRELLITKVVMQYGFLCILGIAILTGVLRYTGFYLQGKTNFHWREAVIESSVSSLLPILPLVYPIIWITINLWGMARLQTMLNVPQSMLQTQEQKSFQEDLDTPTLDFEHVKLCRRTVLYHWSRLLCGDAQLLGRSTNVVQVLGTVTALCCVDKKGILSWPNPTAEKVFFLRDGAENASVASDLSAESSEPGKTGPVAEVLDLTHDQHSPFKLEFDDQEWKNHLSSLKPMGKKIKF